MSTNARRCCTVLAALSLCLMLSCSAGSGGGGLTVTFTIGGKTFVFSFGDVGRIEVQAGETTRVPTTRGPVFPSAPSDTPPSGSMRLPSDSVNTFGRGTAKAIARSQALPLIGSATIRILVAPGSSTDPCDDGILLAEYDISYTTGVTAVFNEVAEISADALAIVLTNDVTFCIEVTADFDAEFTIGQVEITLGGGTGTGTFYLFNTDTVENIHILLPGEDFDASNRLTPGSDRTATVSDLEVGSSVTIRAGRNGTVLDTTTCPAFTGPDYEAIATWDGDTVICTSDSGGDDGVTVPPGTIIQVPIANAGGSAVVAPVTTTIDGVDYGVVGVLEAQTAAVTAGGNPLIEPSPISLDLTELGLETVETLYAGTHSSFVPNLPAGVTMATLTVTYAEGGTPTTLDLITGVNTAEWSYDRPEHLTEFGGVAHPQAPVLYSFPTTISSSSEYAAYNYAVSLSLDTSRTPACLSLTMSDPSAYAGLRVGTTETVPGSDWGEQALMAITLEGPAGTPSVIGDCSGAVTPVDDDGTIFCDDDTVCAADEICTPDGVCILIDFGDPVDIDGDFDDDEATLVDTPEAELMCRTGDIDNLGFGWPEGFDPFSGDTTPTHGYPWEIDPTDPPGTDRIMVISSYVGSPPAGRDGYTSSTSRPDNDVQPITLNCDLGGITVTSAILQIFVDDFQAPVWAASYEVTLDGQRATFLEDIINSLAQTGPVGQLISVDVPSEFLSLLSDGRLELLFDDNTTGAGDGYAIDFVKLLINPGTVARTGTVTGTVVDEETGLPISGATVSAGGISETTTDANGQYTLNDVPAGLVVLAASASGYGAEILSANLVADSSVEVDFRLTLGDDDDTGSTVTAPTSAVCPAEFIVDTGVFTPNHQTVLFDSFTPAGSGFGDYQATCHYVRESHPEDTSFVGLVVDFVPPEVSPSPSGACGEPGDSVDAGFIFHSTQRYITVTASHSDGKSVVDMPDVLNEILDNAVSAGVGAPCP